MGRKKVMIVKWSRSHDQDGCHANKCSKTSLQPFWSKYQVSVYRTNGPLVSKKYWEDINLIYTGVGGGGWGEGEVINKECLLIEALTRIINFLRDSDSNFCVFF